MRGIQQQLGFQIQRDPQLRVGVGDKAKDMVDYAEQLAAGFDAETVERAKAEAIIKAAEIRGDEPTGSA